MTRTLKFYGASDDLFEVHDSTGKETDEYPAYKPATVQVSTNGGSVGLYVTAHYAVAPCGCWTIGIAPIDEDQPLPGWPMRWRAEGYSTVLEIEVPADAIVTDQRSEDD